MRKIYLFFFIIFAFCLWSPFSYEPSRAQNNASSQDMAAVSQPEGLKELPKSIRNSKAAGAVFARRRLWRTQHRLFEAGNTRIANGQQLSAVLNDGIVFDLDHQAVAELMNDRVEFLALSLPDGRGGSVDLELIKADIFAPGFSVQTAVPTTESLEDALGIHYRGIVSGNEQSVAAVSVFKDEIIGFFSTETNGNSVLGRLRGNTPSDTHIIYAEQDLKVTTQISCDTKEPDLPQPESLLEAPSGLPGSCVRIYVEADFDVFQNKGSVTNSVNYVTALFNQSATLFANDGISVSLPEVFVWNTQSPYTGLNSPDELIDKFVQTRTSFNGDLAHLVALRGNGGIAFVNAFCKSSRHAFSGIFSTFSDVPTYSWSVEVFTHESGHLMGSRHTHACVWNGNGTAIDGCGPTAGFTEGSCSIGPIPSNGGTIMSYCHLLSTGINFSLGFGPQPRDVIVNRINSVNCLSSCGVSGPPAAPLAQSATSVTSTSFTANWNSSTGATGYRLDVSTSNTFSSFVPGYQNLDVGNVLNRSVTGLNLGTNYFYRVRAYNAGGTSGNSGTIAVTTATSTGINYALAANGGVASASSTLTSSYLPSTVNNGERAGGNSTTGGVFNGWISSSPTMPQWLQVDFGQLRSIQQIDVFMVQDNYQNPSPPTLQMTNSLFGLQSFEVQYWNGSSWLTVPGGSVTGNNKVWRQFTFAAISTSKIRVLTNASPDSYSRLTELEAWSDSTSPPPPPPSSINFALPANGGVASASSTLTSSYLPSTVNNGERAGGNSTTGGVFNGWISSNQTMPQWLQVDFGQLRSIQQVDVFMVQDNYQNPSPPTLEMTNSLFGLQAFEVQYWNGSSWLTVPGGSVTGNNKVWRQFTFATISTSKIRVLTSASPDSYSRLTELEAWSNSTSPPPSVINFALPANGGVASALSTLTSSYLPSTVNNGERAGGNSTTGGVFNGWISATQAMPQWLQVDFGQLRSIQQIDVFMVQDNYQSPSPPTLQMTNSLFGLQSFEVQYWNGSSWLTVPGGSVTGNNKVWRQFTFTAISTSKVRVLVSASPDSYSRLTELEAWGSPGP